MWLWSYRFLGQFSMQLETLLYLNTSLEHIKISIFLPVLNSMKWQANSGPHPNRTEKPDCDMSSLSKLPLNYQWVWPGSDLPGLNLNLGTLKHREENTAPNLTWEEDITMPGRVFTRLRSHCGLLSVWLFPHSRVGKRSLSNLSTYRKTLLLTLLLHRQDHKWTWPRLQQHLRDDSDAAAAICKPLVQ